ERIGITKNGARFNPRTGLRNTALRQFISVRGIASGDAPVNHNRTARGGWRRRAAAGAQSCYGQGVVGTAFVGSHFAYHHYKRVPVVHINVERLIRIRAGPTVSNPVVAD